MNSTSKSVLCALAVSAVVAFAGQQAKAESYQFTLHNNSQYAINGFQTFEEGKWSSWTGVKAGPGQSIGMTWNSDSGECTVPFRILYRDVETEQYSVDWCKISNIYVSDDKVTAN